MCRVRHSPAGGTWWARVHSRTEWEGVWIIFSDGEEMRGMTDGEFQARVNAARLTRHTEGPPPDPAEWEVAVAEAAGRRMAEEYAGDGGMRAEAFEAIRNQMAGIAEGMGGAAEMADIIRMQVEEDALAGAVAHLQHIEATRGPPRTPQETAWLARRFEDALNRVENDIGPSPFFRLRWKRNSSTASFSSVSGMNL